MWSTHLEGVEAARRELERSLAGEEDGPTTQEDERSTEILRQLAEVLPMPPVCAFSSLPRPAKRQKQREERPREAPARPGPAEEEEEQGYGLPVPSSHLAVVEGAPRPQTRPKQRHEGAEGKRLLERVQVDLGGRAEDSVMLRSSVGHGDLELPADLHVHVRFRSLIGRSFW